jgi:hypothetical protein
MGKSNIHAMQRRMHHGFEPSEEFPMEEIKKEKKKATEEANFSKNIF